TTKRCFGTPPPTSRVSPPFSKYDPGSPTARATSMIEAALCDGHLSSYPSGLGALGGFRGLRGYGRAACTRRIRVGNWNLWRLNRKGLGGGGKWLQDLVIGLYNCEKRSRSHFAVELNDKIAQVGLSDIVKKSFWDALDELSGGYNTQIDYLLVRKGDLRACKDCRVFPSEACSSQHRLVTLDALFERQRQRRVRIKRPRIMWKNLNEDAVETFRAKVFKKLSTL
nr:ATPase, F1 complex alpha/beta subunit, N-terminal domain-containing protein [Tanacetum cinerariifolium]